MLSEAEMGVKPLEKAEGGHERHRRQKAWLLT